MVRRRCRTCGLPILRARSEEGETLLLDSTDVATGVRRWMILDYGDEEQPALVAPLDARSPESGHQEHEVTCPLR